MIRFLAALMIVALCSQADAKTQRSYAAKAEFKRQQPCPATGKPRGRCPGWEVDHRIPLKCNGADSPENMQWLTVAAHKRKTAREAWRCRR